MGGATILGTRAAKDAGPCRLKHKSIHAAGNHIHFPPQRGYPKGVNNVQTLELKLNRFAARETNLIRQFNGLTARRQITDAPPPLLAGDGNLEAACRRGSDQVRQQREPIGKKPGQYNCRKDDPAADNEESRVPPDQARTVDRHSRVPTVDRRGRIFLIVTLTATIARSASYERE
jgi:hypothetical protein